MLSDDVLYMSVRELGSQIKARKIRPVQLTESYLARLEKFGAKLGAVATLTSKHALQLARQAEKEIDAGNYRGPLHGIPFGVKDLLATKGIKTTWGAPPFRDQVFDYDATVIRKLTEAGAILVAKLAMIELAGGGGYSNASASLQGPSRCPFNTDHWAGGSSSGPGAAVPSALVPFAIGSETIGSIITPAAFSGVSGLRPTYGRVSRHGAMALSWTMDKLGPMCRTASDCGLVLDAIAGFDPLDETSVRTPYISRPARRVAPGRAPLDGKRIGVIRPDFKSDGDPEVQMAFTVALETLRGLGAKLEETELPDYPYSAIAVTLYSAEAASIFRPLIQSEKLQQLIDESQKIGLVAALSIPATDYLDSFRLRSQIQTALAKMFERFDVLVAPSRMRPAPRVDADFNVPPAKNTVEKSSDKPTEKPSDKSADKTAVKPAANPPHSDERHSIIAASNIAGLPAISVPCGFTKDHLPVGIQFVAAALADDTCIGFAHNFQKVTDWHQRRPSGF
jgi:aspartyl-tRNA(Asn)/glutamyl-tRNA(Gln) amidotransferase subunit A